MPKSQTIPWLKVLSINFGSISLLILLVEALLAAFRPIGESNLSVSGWRWSDSPYRTYLLDSGIRGKNFWGPEETNQLGFQGRAISYDGDTNVVLLVGDSYVEAAASRFEEIPEVILERSLKSVTAEKIKVFSIGATGWSQDQQLLALREYFARFRANLVLLWHTPNNDFWENAFPDRSRQPAQDGAGHLKPVFTLRDKNNPESYDVELFRPVINSNIATNILRRFNVGRGILRILARFGWEYENDIALKQWLHLIPSANGHLNVDESQCPIEKIELWKMINDYDRYADRLITVETDEAVEESRSHLTPFLETLSLRDEYTKRITHALLMQIKALAEMNGADFRVFAPELRFDGRPFFSGVSCVERRNQFFRVNPDLLAPMTEWKDDVNFQKLVIEIGAYGLSSTTNDRADRHLNFFGNKLVLEAVAETVHFPLSIRKPPGPAPEAFKNQF